MATSTFTYFNLRARGVHIHLLLEFSGEKYDNKAVTFQEWPTIKPTMPFGQIPFYKDEKVAIPQSHAIARYLASKHGLYGKNEVDRAHIDVIYEAFEDLQREVHKIIADPAYATKKETLIKETFPKHYAALEAIF